jgi:hypothetical protein
MFALSLFFFSFFFLSVLRLLSVYPHSSRAMQRPADMDEPEWLHSRLFAPHIESFNFFLQEGLNLAVADMDATSVQIPDGPRVTGMY